MKDSQPYNLPIPISLTLSPLLCFFFHFSIYLIIMRTISTYNRHHSVRLSVICTKYNTIVLWIFFIYILFSECLNLSLLAIQGAHNYCPIHCSNGNELIGQELWDTLYKYVCIYVCMYMPCSKFGVCNVPYMFDAGFFREKFKVTHTIQLRLGREGKGFWIERGVSGIEWDWAWVGDGKAGTPAYPQNFRLIPF